MLWCEAPIFHAIIFFSGGQIHEAENAISYSIFYDYYYTGPYGSHDGFNGMPLSDQVVEKNYGITGTTISDFANSMQVLARVTEKPYHELKDMSEQASEMEDATELDQFNKKLRIRMHTCW